MKKITNIFLLSAGILLSLTGCQKGTDIENSGNAVSFSVSTGYETRTVYSGVRDENKKIERIDWVGGDKIMIWSDNATIRPGGTPYFEGNQNLAVYTIIGTSITASEEKSTASISDPDGNGLRYPEGDPGSTFWGAYPATAVKASPTGGNKPSVSLKIESEQTMSANSKTDIAYDYVPDMQQALMLGYVANAKESAENVDVKFKPAFTDFEFNITTKLDKALTVTAVEITSTTSALSGGFTATCTNGTWSYTAATNAVKSVKATLPGNGLTIDTNNPTLSLNVFALPEDLTNLKVTFYTSEGTKTVKMIEKKTSSTAADSYLTFAGCKKHRINGLLLPTGWYFSYLTLDLKVLDWEAVTVDGASNEFPQAAQFSITGDGVLNGNSDLKKTTPILDENGDPVLDDNGKPQVSKDPWRQRWYFKGGQTVDVFFKVMLPAGGTWEVELMGGTEENPVPADAALFKVTNISPSIDDNTPTVATNLYGPMRNSGSTEVELTIEYIGPAGEAHSCYFHSYVWSGANRTGTKYNIDSETQLYDRGRGYHTFYVNNELYPNND